MYPRNMQAFIDELNLYVMSKYNRQVYFTKWNTMVPGYKVGVFFINSEGGQVFSVTDDKDFEEQVIKIVKSQLGVKEL